MNSAKRWIDINIFKAERKKSGPGRTEVMPINPLPSDRSVGKGRFVKWQAPKKSERAHLNDLGCSSPQPCLWFWKEEADMANSVCGLTQSQVDRQVIGGQSKQTVKGRARARERETGMEQSWKWMQMEVKAAKGGAWGRVRKWCVQDQPRPHWYYLKNYRGYYNIRRHHCGLKKS